MCLAAAERQSSLATRGNAAGGGKRHLVPARSAAQQQGPVSGYAVKGSSFPFKLPPVHLEYDAARIDELLRCLVLDAGERAVGFDLEWRPMGR